MNPGVLRVSKTCWPNKNRKRKHYFRFPLRLRRNNKICLLLSWKIVIKGHCRRKFLHKMLQVILVFIFTKQIIICLLTWIQQCKSLRPRLREQTQTCATKYFPSSLFWDLWSHRSWQLSLSIPSWHRHSRRHRTHLNIDFCCLILWY